MTVVPRSSSSSTASWRRAASSSQPMSFRCSRSAASPYSASGTSRTTAASPESTTSRVPAGAGAASARTTPKTYQPVPSGRGGAGTASSSASVIASTRTARAFSRASARACATTSPTSSAAIAASAARRSASRTVAHLPLELLEAIAQVAVLLDELAPGLARQRGIGLPPVDAHLARPVDRRDEQPELDGQQLDVEQIDLDVAGDDDALVEPPLEDVGEARRPVGDRHRGLALGEAALPRLPPPHVVARVAGHPPVLLQVAALVERDLVAGEDVGRVGHAPQLEQLERHLPAVLGAAQAEHALDRPARQDRDLLDGAARDVDRPERSVAVARSGHVSSPPGGSAGRPRGARTPPRRARRDRTRPPAAPARPAPARARRAGARPRAGPARRPTARRAPVRGAGSAAR